MADENQIQSWYAAPTMDVATTMNVLITTGGKSYRFKPREDVSPYEVALILKLFLLCVGAAGCHNPHGFQALIDETWAATKEQWEETP